MTYKLRDAILSITHNGYSYKEVIKAVEQLTEQLGNNEEVIIDALEEYYNLYK